MSKRREIWEKKEWESLPFLLRNYFKGQILLLILSNTTSVQKREDFSRVRVLINWLVWGFWQGFQKVAWISISLVVQCSESISELLRLPRRPSVCYTCMSPVKFRNFTLHNFWLLSFFHLWFPPINREIFLFGIITPALFEFFVLIKPNPFRTDP